MLPLSATRLRTSYCSKALNRQPTHTGDHNGIVGLQSTQSGQIQKSWLELELRAQISVWIHGSHDLAHLRYRHLIEAHNLWQWLLRRLLRM